MSTAITSQSFPGFHGADLAAHPKCPSVVAGGRREGLHRPNNLPDQPVSIR